MPGPKVLKRAERLLRARRYAAVISLLESQVFLYRNNHSFYRLLGTACLYTGDFGGAHSYLQRAEQLRPGDTAVQLALTAVHLRRQEVPEALRCLLQVLDREPSNQRAKHALALVRRTEDPADFVGLAESGRLAALVPRPGLRVPRSVLLGAAVVGAAAVLAVGLPAVFRVLRPSAAPRDGVEAIARANLPSDLTAFEGEFRYVLSDEEVTRAVRRVGELFNSFRDNLARREANRLLLSNASPAVKERIRMVASHFQVPTFVDFRDNFTYEEVAAEPWLYAGCHVRWSGQTSNIVVGEDAIRFTLLVGYEDQRTLEGTVPVTVPFVADVQPGGVELIGRVEISGSLFTLTATSIRRIVPARSR